jgi:hypothetical protein
MFVSCECLCCQVEGSATDRSLVQRSPTDCGVCLSVMKCKIKTLDTYCEKVGRRGKDCETKRNKTKRNIEWRSRNYCWCRKALSIAYSECVSVALVTQHAKRMSRIILSSVTCLAVPYFSTAS